MNLETPSMQSSDDSESDDTSRSQAPSFNPAFDSPDGDIGTPILWRHSPSEWPDSTVRQRRQHVFSYTLFYSENNFFLVSVLHRALVPFIDTLCWFRTMLSLPQGQSSPVEVIFMEEDEDTLELLLRMISGLPLLPIVHYDVVDKILFAAEKYDMPGPIGVIRLLVMTPPFLDSPFRLYTVACRYGWEEEARFASTQTLTHHLHDPQVRQGLRRLSTDALLDLISLHHSRKESLRDRLNKPPFVASENAASTCGNCNAPLDYHTWRILKFRMIQEIEIRPLGDTILDKGLVDWPEAKACWLAKCPNRVCARSLYDQEPTMRIIKECIDELPRSI